MLTEVTDEMAEVVLRAFASHSKREPKPLDPSPRNIKAMRAGLEELRATQIAAHSSPVTYIRPRGYEIIKMMATEGLKYKEIALKLDISVSTVRTHLHDVYGLIGMRADRGVVTHMFLQGFIQPATDPSALAVDAALSVA